MNISSRNVLRFSCRLVIKKERTNYVKNSKSVGSKTVIFISDSALRQIGVKSHRFTKPFCIHHQEINFIIIIKICAFQSGNSRTVRNQ